MDVNKVPTRKLESTETMCCPEFEPKPWDELELLFDNKLFVLGTTINIFHMPLNMGGMMKKSWSLIEKAGAAEQDTFLLLSYDPSPWKGEHYFAVTKEVPGMPTVKMSGTFLTKVFEGSYEQVPKWVKEMEEYVVSKGKQMKKLFFYYTTCPKCAKHWGKNYLVGFAQVE